MRMQRSCGYTTPHLPNSSIGEAAAGKEGNGANQLSVAKVPGAERRAKPGA